MTESKKPTFHGYAYAASIPDPDVQHAETLEIDLLYGPFATREQVEDWSAEIGRPVDVVPINLVHRSATSTVTILGECSEAAFMAAEALGESGLNFYPGEDQATLWSGLEWAQLTYESLCLSDPEGNTVAVFVQETPGTADPVPYSGWLITQEGHPYFHKIFTDLIVGAAPATPTPVQTPLAFVTKHPDGSVCPENSWPRMAGSCPLIGTGVHAGARFMVDITTTEDEILNHLLGPLDVEHFVASGERRRVMHLPESVPPEPSEVLYEKCLHCHLFVDENPAFQEGVLIGGMTIATHVHLHRGDDVDEALDASHTPEPSGRRANLLTWKTYGPEAMRERFTE